MSTLTSPRSIPAPPHTQYLPTRSPRASAEQLAFLPHPHAAGSPGAPYSAPLENSSSSGSGSSSSGPSSPRSSYSRTRSHTSSSSGFGSSMSPRVRSAPTSPSGRSYRAGLAPLSVISPIKLGTSLPGMGEGMMRDAGESGGTTGRSPRANGYMTGGGQGHHSPRAQPGLPQQYTSGAALSPARRSAALQDQVTPEMGSRAISDTTVSSRPALTPEQLAQLQYDQQRAATIAQTAQNGKYSPSVHAAPNSAPSASHSLPLPFAPPNQLVQHPQQHQQVHLQHQQMRPQHTGGSGSAAQQMGSHPVHAMPVPQRIMSQPLRATQSLHTPPMTTQQQAYYHQQQLLQQRQHQAQIQAQAHAAQAHNSTTQISQQRRPTVPFPPSLSPRTPNSAVLPTSAAIASMELSGARPKPRLLRSRSRSRHKTGSTSGLSGSETETGMDSDTTMTPHRIKKNSGSLSQPNLTSLRSRLEGWAGDVAMQSQGAGVGGVHPVAHAQADGQGQHQKQVEGQESTESQAYAGVQAQGLGLEVGQGQSSTVISAPQGVARRASYKKGRTPPSHAVSLPSSPGSEGFTDLPRRSPSRSITHLSSLRLSPVTSTTNFAALQSSRRLPRRDSGPETGATFPAINRRTSTDTRGSDDSLGSFESSGSLGSIRPVPVGAGTASSEDADDSLDSTSTGDASSPSSGSLSFEPRRRNTRWRGHSQGDVREKERLSSFGSAGKSSLGLSFDDIRPGFAPRVVSLGAVADTIDPRNVPSKDQRKAAPRSGSIAPLQAACARIATFVRMILGIGTSNMWSLRMLAVFPAAWGWLVLMQAVITGGLWVDVYPWGIDTSREALDRLIMGGKAEGRWEAVERGDMLLSSLWAILTAHYCFEMTTGLTRRWRVYYDLPATITRLLSIQCICWPLTGLTLWVLGHERTLFAWVVIGVTTAASRSVQMYVTSNIPGSVIERRRAEPKRQGSGEASGGDETDTPKRSRAHLVSVTSMQGEDAGIGAGSNGKEGEKGWVESKRGREWRWDAVAEEVGWKAGLLLLLTCAWLFWGIEMGRWKE